MTNDISDWGTAVKQAAGVLRAAGFDQSVRDVRVLLAHALDTTPDKIFAWPETSISAEDVAALMVLVERRLAHEPLSRILGQREFWSLSFSLSPETLDPRPDSESIIEAVLAQRPETDKEYRLLDLGTGTGCLLAALLSEYGRATGIATDLSEGAATTAQGNIADLGLGSRADVRVGDWDEGLEGLFDIIVSNPPYIPDAEILTLDAGVTQYDPGRALSGGEDGLVAYRQLSLVLLRRLSAAGVAVLEFGHGQADDVGDILISAGLEVIDWKQDLAGRKRCVVCRLTTIT